MTARVDMFTDGACSGNPGPGGWGAILRCGAHEKELSGGENATTNNRMELMAVIEGLKALKNAVRRHHPHRFPLCDGRGVEMAEGLEDQGLEDRRQEAGEE